jgi:hypothetical protein
VEGVSLPHPLSVNTAAAAVIKVVLFIHATFIFSLYFTIAKWVTNVNRFLNLVDTLGLEPRTYRLKARCSTY